MSLALHFSLLLRHNIRSSYHVRLLKQQAGFLSGKLFDPRTSEKRHFSCVPGIQLWHQQNSELDKAGTVLVFDVETTGYPHKCNRIIEIALRDLSGGKNCTFETLINPERDVPKYISHLNGIYTDLVCRPGIPRFSDVLPLLLAFIRSHQVLGKPIIWVGHTATQFNVPFLVKEFRRCSAEIPADWIFVDSLSLARKVVASEVKSTGLSLIHYRFDQSTSTRIYCFGGKRRATSLEALREHYGIHSAGKAHRAMRDVTILSQILQNITFDLKLTYEGLRNVSVRASDCRKIS